MEIESALGQFQGKRVLVTGDTGFKGSWLSLWLHQLGAEVWGYALPAPSEQDLFNSIKLGQLIHHVDGDICDPPGFQKVLNDARHDGVTGKVALEELLVD